MKKNLYRIEPDNTIYKKSKEYESWVWNRTQIEEKEYGILFSHDLVESYRLRMLFGDDSKTFFEQLQSLYGKFPLCLSLGCGSGFEELRYLESGLIDKLIGVDISNDALKKFEERTKGKFTIETRQADANFIEIEPDTYDLILVKGAMHHFINLEHIMNQIYSGLKKDGLFILAEEYIGPNKYQWDETTLRFINAIGYYLSRDFTEIQRLNVVNTKYLKYFSPFEAVFSNDIIPVVQNYFDFKYQAIYGNIISPISGCFEMKTSDGDDPRFINLINKIINFDDYFRKNSILPDNQAFILCHKKPTIKDNSSIQPLTDKEIKYHIGLEFNVKGFLLQKYIARYRPLRSIWTFLKKMRSKIYKW